ncbi:hypothetical protein B0I37DRAFT_352517 [Chaetomium sp. MPI-CAGE-AT-0009]|nr:hypothetical protein B0I37DRAFT_352517 [Chaetomium sp. MPI-CAGE-AT-0009]
MPGEEFITLRQAQPQRPPYNPVVNQAAFPPTPGYPGQIGQQPDRTINAGGQQYYPRSPVGQQYYPRVVPASTPQLRHRQYATAQPDSHVEISDLRKERPLTDEEAREKEREARSQYFVIRIVRDEGGRHASDGTKRKLSWGRVQFIPDPIITKKEAARAVRKLDQTTISVTEKMRDLAEDQRRQVELACISLQQKWDDESFQTSLVQLEDQVEEKSREIEREGGAERERRKDRHRKEDAGRSGLARVSSKPHSKSKQPKKVAPERVSITAYFKRAPRLEVDPFSIPQSPNPQLNAQVAEVQQAYSQPATQPVAGYYPPPSQQNIPPPQKSIPPPQQNIPPPRQNIPPPQLNNPPPQLNNPPPQLNNPPPQPPPRPAETRGPNPAHHAQPYAHSPKPVPAQPARRPSNAAAKRASSHQRSPHHRRPSPPVRSRARSQPSTDESVYSPVFSDADDDTDYTNPSTPSYVSNRYSFDRPRQNSRYKESPAHYGIQPKFRHSKPQGEVYIQPYRSHERRPDLGGRQHTIPVLKQEPLPRQTSDPAPSQGFPQFRPGNANMASAVPRVAPSQPPTAQTPAEPRPAGPAQFPPPPPPPGAQSQGRTLGHVPPGYNPSAFPGQPGRVPTPGQHNPGPAPGQHGQGFPAGPASYPPPNTVPRGPGPINGMNGMDPINQAHPMNPGNQANPMNPNQPGNPAGNPAGNPVNGPNPAMNPRGPGNVGNPGNPGGHPSQNPPQNPALNPTALYAKGYAKGRADIHEEALHMAERVAERVVAAAVPLKAEGKRRGTSPVVIQQDRSRGRAGRRPVSVSVSVSVSICILVPVSASVPVSLS